MKLFFISRCLKLAHFDLVYKSDYNEIKYRSTFSDMAAFAQQLMAFWSPQSNNKKLVAKGEGTPDYNR